MITVSIVGASGYAGGELLRLLLNHPQVEISQVTANRLIGEAVTLNHPNLRKVTGLYYVSLEDLKPCDLLIVSLPNGLSMNYMGRFKKLAGKIIDLGADFRLRNVLNWENWYKSKHREEKLLGKFIYGLPELHRQEIKKARCVAGPGCEAAVSILSLAPLIKNKVSEPDNIFIDAKMGSSQSGSKATASSHHPERSGAVRSYMPTGHRHTAEIEQELSMNNIKPKVSISATAIDMVRGLLVTIQTSFKKGKSQKDVWEAYHREYENEPFMRIVKQRDGLYRYPEPKILSGSNFCDIGFEADGEGNRLVVIGAIDNLGKGTAGNAVQCLNLMFNLPETTGLNFTGLHPI